MDKFIEVFASNKTRLWLNVMLFLITIVAIVLATYFGIEGETTKAWRCAGVALFTHLVRIKI